MREVIEAHELRAKKSLGQNFLLDLNITDKIVRHAGDLKGVNVFEIGPGPGGLTRSLLKSPAKTVTAIEFDDRAIAALQPLKEISGGEFNVIHADALETDLTQIAPAPRAIAANLPYNIATPLLVNWLRQIHENKDAYQSMTLMFQKEVAQRIVAQAGNKTYGRLAILAQWLCHARIAFDLPPSAFTPPPKVTSSVVHFIPKKLEPGAPAFEAIEKLTAEAFGQRRKMIRQSLKNYKDKIEKTGIDETLRAEDLTVEQFIALAKN